LCAHQSADPLENLCNGCYYSGMAADQLCQAQAYWNRTKAAGWSDEQTKSQIRREAGVIQHGLDFIFSDGSVLRDLAPPLGRKLTVHHDRAGSATCNYAAGYAMARESSRQPSGSSDLNN
jgi:hypothetical protein